MAKLPAPVMVSTSFAPLTGAPVCPAVNPGIAACPGMRRVGCRPTARAERGPACGHLEITGPYLCVSAPATEQAHPGDAAPERTQLDTQREGVRACTDPGVSV
ncbi:MAG: hypothetical protein ACYCYA_14555 [Actinomycetes bacterium]